MSVAGEMSQRERIATADTIAMMNPHRMDFHQRVVPSPMERMGKCSSRLRSAIPIFRPGSIWKTPIPNATSITPRWSQKKKIRTAINNSFGFGGHERHARSNGIHRLADRATRIARQTCGPCAEKILAKELLVWFNSAPWNPLSPGAR